MQEHSAAERWLPIPGYEGAYEVSDLGRVRSVDRLVQCSSGETRRRRQHYLKPKLGTTGRLHVVLYRNNVRKEWTVHVLVLTSFVGPRPDDLHCCHNNGIPTDNRVANLRWDTRSENQRDAVKHGTHPMARRTHCPQGHPLEAPNLAAGVARMGYRNCLACHRARNNQRDAKRCGLGFDFQAAADQHYEDIMNGVSAVTSRDKTHCPQGHPLAEPNLEPASARKGLRRCLACVRAHANESHAKRLGRPFDFVAAAYRHYEQIVSGTGPVLNGEKTLCPRGHVLAHPNLIPAAMARGSRGCLACDRAKGNARYAKRRGRPFDFQATADRHYAEIMTT